MDVSTFTFWHTTTHENAAAIMASGFKDSKSVRVGMFNQFEFPDEGVWVSSLPAFDDDCLDGIGMFGFDVSRQAFISIEINQVVADTYKEVWEDGSWSAGSQMRFSAELLNRFKRALVSPEDALRYRLMHEPEVKEYIAEAINENREYGLEFLEIAKRVL